MSLQAVGTLTDPAVVFNRGVVTVNGVQLAEVTNVNVNMSTNVVKNYGLNKRIPGYIRGGNYTFGAEFTCTAGSYRELTASFFDSSSPVGSGLMYEPTPIQPTAITFVITVYENDDLTKPIQYQFVQPILSDVSEANQQENFQEVTVKVDCVSIQQYRANTAN